jgi:hypothetical protein
MATLLVILLQQLQKRHGKAYVSNVSYSTFDNISCLTFDILSCLIFYESCNVRLTATNKGEIIFYPHYLSLHVSLIMGAHLLTMVISYMVLCG